MRRKNLSFFAFPYDQRASAGGVRDIHSDTRGAVLSKIVSAKQALSAEIIKLLRNTKDLNYKMNLSCHKTPADGVSTVST